MNRRDLLKLLPAAAGLCLFRGRTFAAPSAPDAVMNTYTYKSVGDCRIKADVYYSISGKTARPVIVCIHGGALITGGRYPISMDLFHPLLARGYAVVSIDYRLAPETKLPEIIKDVQDAWRWVRGQGPELFGADPERMAVQGGSAGGYLTLMTGFCVDPRPKALVSFYGYGDIVGEWYSRSDPFYSAQPLVSNEAAYSAVGEGIPCGHPQGNRRHEFYLYCRQNGLWPKEVSGFDPKMQPEAFKPYCPLQNVTAQYPPTLLAHGDTDTDVPYDQSVRMDAALTREKVEHEFITLKGAGHGFSHSNKEEYQALLERTAAFLAKHIG